MLTKFYIVIFSIICLIYSTETYADSRVSSMGYIFPNKITINNFGMIDIYYYRSGQLQDDEYKQLSMLGIKTIIDLRYPFRFVNSGIEKGKVISNRLGINYINIPMLPFIPPSDKQINEFFSILANPNNLPVLIHCNHGKDRVGIMTALYRVECYNWDYDQAYSEMLAYGYHRFLYPQQKKFLSKYVKCKQLSTCNKAD